MRSFSLSAAVVFLALGLSGCSAIEKHSNDAPQVVAAPDAVSAMLASAADRASNALEALAAVEKKRTPTPTAAPIGNAPPELRRAVTVNWIGPVEPIAQTLANRAGYEFLAIGAQPVAPVVVSIDVENKPVIDILRDVGLQLGVRGKIKVDGRRRMVEIHYAAHTGGG